MTAFGAALGPVKSDGNHLGFAERSFSDQSGHTGYRCFLSPDNPNHWLSGKTKIVTGSGSAAWKRLNKLNGKDGKV